jgi:hypothetical protein
VTTLRFDENLLVTSGNDGRVRLFETKTGRYVMDLTELAESVCAGICMRAGKTVVEVWSHAPPGVELERAWWPLVTSGRVFGYLGVWVYRWTAIPSGTGARELISA